jgi:ribosomal protein S18 acetylase RimI-like enzyme
MNSSEKAKISKIILRNWTREDFNIVRDILIKTWKAAYTFIPEEDLIFHLEKFYSFKELNQMIEDINIRGIIAEADKNPSAFMKLYIDRGSDRFYVSSLYVLPKCQGYGIGNKLVNTAEREASQNNFDKIWLGVMKSNIKTLDWYKKLNFIFIEEEPFTMGKTVVQHLIGYKLIDRQVSPSE